MIGEKVVGKDTGKDIIGWVAIGTRNKKGIFFDQRFSGTGEIIFDCPQSNFHPVFLFTRIPVSTNRATCAIPDVSVLEDLILPE
jgi:hypothetical protein